MGQGLWLALAPLLVNEGVPRVVDPASRRRMPAAINAPGDGQLRFAGAASMLRASGSLNLVNR